MKRSESAPAWGAWCGRGGQWRISRRRRQGRRRERGRRLWEPMRRRRGGAAEAVPPWARILCRISFLPPRRWRIYSGCHWSERRSRWRRRFCGGWWGGRERRRWGRIWGGWGFCATSAWLAPLILTCWGFLFWDDGSFGMREDTRITWLVLLREVSANLKHEWEEKDGQGNGFFFFFLLFSIFVLLFIYFFPSQDIFHILPSFSHFCIVFVWENNFYF